MPIECGCKWNNNLAREIFTENSEKLGKNKALQLLREDIQSWVRERDGRQFEWSLRVRDNQLVAETSGKSITGMIEDSMYGPHSKTVATSIRENAPLELATAREVTKRAVSGEDRIVFPEYFKTESGETVVRYFTVLTKDRHNPRIYHGSRIDLEHNLSVPMAIQKVRASAITPVLPRVERSQHVEPRSSTVHAVIREAPSEAARVLSQTAAEIDFTAKSVKRYIEKRNVDKAKKFHVKTERRPVDIWRRIVESGKKRVKRAVRLPVRMNEVPAAARKKQDTLHSKQANKERWGLSTETSVKKSILRHENKVRRFMKTEKRREGQTILRTGKRLEKNYMRGAAPAEIRKRLSVKAHEKISYRKEGETQSRIKKIRLITLARRLLRLHERTDIARRSDPVRHQREVTVHFSIAFILWELLQTPVFSQEKMTGSPKRIEKLFTSEPTPWLLLAIIRHLAMIREQGHLQQQSQKKKAKKKAWYPQFAPRGVIFAYAT